MKHIQAAICFLLLALIAAAAAAGDEDAGRVEFRNSCEDSVAAAFNRAVALLHSFEYPESEKAFRAILQQAPDCAIARWGIAMSRWHPLWAPPNRSDLRAGAEALDGAALASTAREAAYLSAIGEFYEDYGNVAHAERARAYRDKMAVIYRHNLDDPEAAVFYALSLLATADPKDKSYANQFKAASLLGWVRDEQPHHPGVLHYIIHSFDFPGLAHPALPAAKIYAGVAPASTHAQHMPSHIFTRLGLWDRSISSNHDSTASAAHYTRVAQLPGHYDEGLHSMDYLLYALLQTGRDNDALREMEKLAAIEKTNQQNFKVAYTYAAAPARYTLERRQWREASEIELQPRSFPWDEFGWARSIVHFARGIGAARSGQIERAREEVAAIRKIETGLGAEVLPYWREEVSVHEEAVLAWIRLTEGDRQEAIRLALSAADREDAVDKHPVTPGEVVPARELLADMLLEIGRATEALAEYETVLEGSPNRYNALLGAGRAAQHGGNTDLARSYFTRLIEQSREGDRKLPDVAAASHAASE